MYSLSRPSLITSTEIPGTGLLNKASKPYPSAPIGPNTLTPLLQLPPAFGAAYVGTTFSCTLCANNELPSSSTTTVSDVQVTAELQTPVGAVALDLLNGHEEYHDHTAASSGQIEPGQTVQKIVQHDLREDGQHVLAVTVTYTERPSDSEEVEDGLKRTFRKLYQFIAQPAVGVRTKISELRKKASAEAAKDRRFVLEAQLENLTETSVVLEGVQLILAKGLRSSSLNWDAEWMKQKIEKENIPGKGRPVLAPQDVMQVAFVLEQNEGEQLEEKRDRVLLAQAHIDWRGPMGEKGELTTGWLGCKSR